MNPSLPAVELPGEEAAPETRFEALLRTYGDFLRRTVRRMCPREPGLSSDDIEQEARISLWRALRSEREILAPVSYIRKVAVSVTLRAVRRARARKEETLDDDRAPARPLYAVRDPSPEDAAGWQECRQQIEAAIRTLAENRRLAVELHLQDLNTREIAELLGWSEPKARNLVHRGLKDLRAALRAVGIEYRR